MNRPPQHLSAAEYMKGNEMPDKIEDLLAVLDMTEEEQCKWLNKNLYAEKYKTSCNNLLADNFQPWLRRATLVDLAFRLRPQPSKEYHQALKIVYDYLWRKGKVSCDYVNWLEFHITPKDRIIAALIALAKKGESDG